MSNLISIEGCPRMYNANLSSEDGSSCAFYDCHPQATSGIKMVVIQNQEGQTVAICPFLQSDECLALQKT